MTEKSSAKVPGRDAIERELHTVREEYARKFGYDVHDMFEDVREKQAQSRRAIVSFSPKRIAERQREGKT